MATIDIISSRLDLSTEVRDAQWAAEPVSLFQIVRHLLAHGVPSPRGGQWTINAVYRFLTNPAYYGEAIAHRIERRGRQDRVRDPSEWVDSGAGPGKP